jgi:hypothetical protein
MVELVAQLTVRLVVNDGEGRRDRDQDDQPDGEDQPRAEACRRTRAAQSSQRLPPSKR